MKFQLKRSEIPSHLLRFFKPVGHKSKDIVDIPHMVAEALREDGWYLRSAITWCKRAPMPESVTDRPTSATEMIFLLTRAERYYYDADAVREPHARLWDERNGGTWAHPVPTSEHGKSGYAHSGDYPLPNPNGRNMWNYWVLSPESFSKAHFATFPTEIPRRAILAGTSERGCCAGCGAPWRRVVELTPEYRALLDSGKAWRDGSGKPDEYVNRQPKDHVAQVPPKNITTGWAPTCTCGRTDVVPATVLDPFSGAGTTALVALRLGRRAVGIELNPEYIEMSHKRIQGDPAAMNLNMDLREMEEAV